MNTIILAFLLCLSSVVAVAQRSDTWQLSVTDRNKAPLEVATVSVNKKLYYPVGNNGMATLPLSAIKQGDTIFASSLGYVENYIIILNTVTLPKNITLESARFELKEVTVSNKAKKYTVEKMGEMRPLALASGLAVPDIQLALFINNAERKKGYIKNLTFHLKNFSNGIDQPFKIRLYDRKSGSEFPNKELMEEVVVQNTKRKTFFKVDISMYGIQLPEDGFFVVFEALSKQYYDENKAVIKKVNPYHTTYVQYPIPDLAKTISPVKNNLNYSLVKYPVKDKRETASWHKDTYNYLIEAEVSVEK